MAQDKPKRKKNPNPKPFVHEFEPKAMEKIISLSSDVYVCCAMIPEYHIEEEVKSPYGGTWTKRTDLVQAFMTSLNTEEFATNYCTPITPRHMVTDVSSDRHLLDLFSICDAACNILTFTGMRVLWHPRTSMHGPIDWTTDLYEDKNWSTRLRGKGYRTHRVMNLPEHEKTIKETIAAE